MKACIMCGGVGTRLRPLTFERPKPMIPLLNKPSIQHLVENLVSSGLDEIVITLGYQGEKIEEYFGDGSLFGANIKYVYEEKKLGTAGSVKNAQDYLDGDTFLVVGGDLALDFNLKQICDFHKRNASIVTIGLVCMDDPREYGIVEMDAKNELKRFKEKPLPGEVFSNLASTGIYVCDSEIFEFVLRGERYDFAKDLFPRFLEGGKKMGGWLSRGHWSDVGDIKSYREAVRWKLGDMVGTEITGEFYSKGKIRGPISIQNGVKIGRGTSIVGPVIVGENTTIGEDVLIAPYTSLGSNCSIESDSKILSAILYDDVTIEEGSIISSAIIDGCTKIGRDCVIENGVVIGPRSDIGNNSTVRSYVKIWPEMYVPPNSTVSEDILNEEYGIVTSGS